MKSVYYLFRRKNHIIIILRTVWRENVVVFGYFYYNSIQFLCAIKESVLGLRRIILATTVASNCAAHWSKTRGLLIIDDWINREETKGRCELERFLASQDRMGCSGGGAVFETASSTIFFFSQYVLLVVWIFFKWLSCGKSKKVSGWQLCSQVIQPQTGTAQDTNSNISFSYIVLFVQRGIIKLSLGFLLVFDLPAWSYMHQWQMCAEGFCNFDSWLPKHWRWFYMCSRDWGSWSHYN